MKKILIIRFSSLGDIVLLTPAFSKLKEEEPDSEITFLTHERFVPLVQDNPYIHHVSGFPQVARKDRREENFFFTSLQKENFALVFDMHNSMRSRMLCRRLKKSGSKIFRLKKYYFQRYILVLWHKKITSRWLNQREKYNRVLQSAGYNLPWQNSQIFICPHEQRAAKRLFPRAWNFKKTVALAPAAAWALKEWSPFYFVELIQMLMKKNYSVVLLGAATELVCDEIEQAVLSSSTGKKILNLRAKTSLQQAAWVLQNSRLLIGNDSSHIHIAEAMGVPAVSLMGPTSPDLGFAPYLPQSKVAQDMGFFCRPCTRTGKGKCKYAPHALCLQAIQPQSVFELALSILE